MITLTGVGPPLNNYSPDALAYFAQLTGTISTAWKLAVNNLILQLQADGNWSELDRFWIHATENQQNARVSLVNPTSTQITEVNSPTWTADRGYTGDGATMYLNTNYNPNTDGIHYSLNSASLGVYSRVNSDNFQIDIGACDVSSPVSFSQLDIKEGNVIYANVNDYNSLFTANINSLGMFTTLRSAGSIAIYKNGVLLTSLVQASSKVPNLNLFLLARNTAGIATVFSNRQLSISYAGSGAINQTTFYNAIQAFATTIGFNV